MKDRGTGGESNDDDILGIAFHIKSKQHGLASSFEIDKKTIAPRGNLILLTHILSKPLNRRDKYTKFDLW